MDQLLSFCFQTTQKSSYAVICNNIQLSQHWYQNSALTYTQVETAHSIGQWQNL